MLKRLCVSASLLVALATGVRAQSDANRGQIVGTIYDQQQALVPDAAVKVTNVETGLARSVTTNAAGQYRVVLLDAGRYELSVEKAGFAPGKLTGIVLNVGSSVGLDVTLQVGATAQTVVEVSAALLNGMPAPQAVVNMNAITNLPINGRRFQDFATLTPTAQVEPSRGQLSFAGQRGINSNIMVDGADYNQPFFGGIRGGERSNFNFTIPQGAVQEFQAISSGYAAEYGRSTGGVLNVITRSGSNEIHGSAFYQNRDRSLSADNPIFKRQPSESLQQFGGAAGGPIARDRMFWFGALEHQRANTPAQVVFTALTGLASTPANQEALAFFKTLEEDFTRGNKATALTGKADYAFSGGHRLSTRYNHSRSDEPNSVTVGGALNPFTNSAVSNEGTEKDRIHFGTVQYTHLFSPSVINDLKFSESYEVRPRLSNVEAPSVSAGAIGYFGTRSFMPNSEDDWRTQITNALTVIRGRHTVKSGLDYNRLHAAQTFGYDQFGTFSMTNSSDIALNLDILGLGGTYPNRFDNPNVSYRRQVGNLLADYGATQMALFVQDSWRVTPKLTVDMGLRWEAQWNPAVDASNTALVDRVQAPIYPVTGSKLDVTKIDDALKQVMPRIGFAWSPLSASRRMVIRGHGGIFYAATPMLLHSGPTNNFRKPPGDVGIQIGPFTSGSNTVYSLFKQVGVDLNQSQLSGLPIIPLEKVQQAAALASGGVAPDPLIGAGLITFAPDFRNPRSYQWGIGSDFELTGNWLAGAQYLQVNTVHLERNRDWNLPFPTVRAADGRPVFSRANRPVPLQGTFSVRESSARSLYRAMVLQTQYRSRKLTAGVYYARSENFSDDDNERSSGGNLMENVFNLKPEYNYSNLDARHQFGAHAVYSLPLGIEISGLLRARTGLPLNAVVGSDANGDASSGTDRPYSAVGVPFLRNAFRNRGTMNADLRLLKKIKLHSERLYVQLSAEMFNLFNQHNVIFSGQASTYGAGISSTDGKALAIDSRFMLLKTSTGDYDTRTTSQAGSPFQAQFGIRFFF